MGPSFRGQFRRTGGGTVAGQLEFTEAGELELETWGATDDSEGLSDEPVVFEGELVKSPHPTARVVTLLGCLQRESTWGVGGSTERWFVQRAVFGDDVVNSDARFANIEFSIDGLADFISAPAVSASVPLRQVRCQIATEGWRIALGLGTSVTHSRDELTYRQQGFAHAALDREVALMDLLRETQPVFELVLSIAGGGHARVLSTVVSPHQSDRKFFVRVGPIDSVPRKASAPIFYLAQHPDPALLFRSARTICNEQPAFVAHYLSLLRSPSRLIDERVRGALNSLALLLSETEPPPPVPTTIPTELRDFLPPSSILALPSKLEALLTGPVVSGLRISDPEALVRGVRRAYRWANFHDGEAVSGRELFNVGQRLRALIHLCVLLRLGLDEDFALSRIGGRWPTLVETAR